MKFASPNKPPKQDSPEGKIVTIFLLDDDDYPESANLRMVEGDLSPDQLRKLKVKWAFLARVEKDIFA